MKRFISLLLALAICFTLTTLSLAESDNSTDTDILVSSENAVPASEETVELGEEGMDEKLQAIILQVKETLGVDDSYASFTSQYNDDLVPKWYLLWSDDTKSLSVDVTTEGKIVSISHWEDGDKQNFYYGYDTGLPDLTQEEADQQAKTWYDRLFTGNETGRTDFTRVSLGNPSMRRYNGVVDLNGLPSPITFSLSVTDQGIDTFYRSDAYMGYVGIVPDSEPLVEESDAALALADTAKMDLYFVPDGDGKAVLHYVPISPKMVVDAKSGEVVDMDALYESVGGTEGTGYAEYAEDSVAGAGYEKISLTEAELSAIDEYGDIMSAEALDQSLRSLDGLGLEKFNQENCSYSMDEENDEITATIRYTATMTEDDLYGFSEDDYLQAVQAGEDMTIRKNITADAKTGEIKGVYTSYPLTNYTSWNEDADTTWDEDSCKAAQSFLEEAVPDKMGESELCTLYGYNDTEEIVFAQIHEGYFYPTNYLQVTINSSEGTVDSFTYNWEEVEFGSIKDIIELDEAIAAYTKALNPVLGYISWPLDLALDENQLYSVYTMWGYSYVEELRLAYYYDNLQQVAGVDALSGQVIIEKDNEGVYIYDDLASVPQADAIATLGEMGIGFESGSYFPENILTERDSLILLLRSAGISVSEDDDTTLQSEGYNQGFLEEKSWDPEEEMTAEHFIHMIISASRYGDAAELLDNHDQEGTQMIAAALGMDVLEPDQILTRADAAEILTAFMSRDLS